MGADVLRQITVSNNFLGFRFVSIRKIFFLAQIETYAKLSGERFMRNGKEYLDFQNIDYELKIGDFKTQFDDLFRDNPELTAVTNRVFNENSQALLPDFEEVFRNVLGNYMLGSLRRIFKTYPLNVMLPEK